MNNKKRIALLLAFSSIMLNACNKSNSNKSNKEESLPIQSNITSSNNQITQPIQSNNEEVILPCDVGYINTDTILYDNNLNPSMNISKYEKVILYNEYFGNNRHICIPNMIDGYVQRDSISVLSNTYVEVDISKQKLYMYKDGEKVMEADVITGKNSTPTNEGYTSIISKEYKRMLNNTNYVDYFFLFNWDEEGFHDADGWRKDYEYNDKELYKNNGSHGCVNMKQKDIELLDSYIEIGTPVLIHK